MHEVHAFGTVVLLVAAGFSLAVGTSRLSERLAVPGPALFLVAAAVVSDIFPKISDRLTIREVERVGVVALVVILFDGGSRIGARRLRAAALPVLSLGVLGTFATAGVTTLAARWLLGFSWTTSGLLGAATAPTDPAVMFSVLGRREVGGRTGTILEAESGMNDPVGIALMIGMIQFAVSAHGAPVVLQDLHHTGGENRPDPAASDTTSVPSWPKAKPNGVAPAEGWRVGPDNSPSRPTA